jgi:hypothetical protein
MDALPADVAICILQFLPIHEKRGFVGFSFVSLVGVFVSRSECFCDCVSRPHFRLKKSYSPYKQFIRQAYGEIVATSLFLTLWVCSHQHLPLLQDSPSTVLALRQRNSP